MTKEFLEGCLAEGLSLDQIAARTGRHPSTVSYHLRKHDLRPDNRAKYASKGGLSREVLTELVAEGFSLRGMARRLDRSPSTVRHWLDKYGLKSKYRSRNRELVRSARAAGRSRAELVCKHHGPTAFYVAPNGSYCWQAVSSGARRSVAQKREAQACQGGRWPMCRVRI